MIEIMITYKELGYVYTHDKSNKIIFGELCNIKHLYEVVKIISSKNNIILYVDSTNSIDRVTSELRDLDVNITKSIINEQLDVSKELLHRVLLSTNKQGFDNSNRKINISCFLIGVMISLCLSVYPAISYFNSRKGLIDSQNEVIKKIEMSAESKINIKSMYQELGFLYNVNEIKLIEVKDKLVKIIFNSSKSGLKPILMKTIHNVSLTENVANSDNNEVIYYYTLTGNIY